MTAWFAKLRNVLSILIAALGLLGLSVSCHSTSSDANGAPHHRDDSVERVDHDHEKQAHVSPDGDHDHDGEAERVVVLSSAQRDRISLTIETAGPGTLHRPIELPGEVVFNGDRVVHLVPRVPGIARSVFKSVGDRVHQGEVLAVIDSRELAEAKATYLAAQARRELSDAVFRRERDLLAKQASSEQELLDARQALTESEIAMTLAVQKLTALGLSPDAVRALDREDMSQITRHEIVAPLDGVVTHRHVVLGETLDGDTSVFTVADTSSVWVELTLFAKHLDRVKTGENVVLRIDHSGFEMAAQIDRISPFLDVSTRSAIARVVVDNDDGRWVPGTFVTATIAGTGEQCALVVPRNAVQDLDDASVVFVPEDAGYAIVEVKVGRMAQNQLELLGGLEPGMPVVAQGAFELKAIWLASHMDAHAGHGH